MKPIIIDEYDPKHPEVQWICDNCDGQSPVTAQFKIGNGACITICALCLQQAAAGILRSLQNPVSFDDAPTDPADIGRPHPHRSARTQPNG